VSSTRQHCDAIVIGAGIAGASVAAFLAPHVRVALLERETQPGMHTTGRSAAMFEESYGPPQVRALTRASRAWFERDAAWLAPRGSLFVGRAEQRDAVDSLHAALAAEGAAVQRICAAKALVRVPTIRPEAAAHALLSEDGCDIDVHAVHQQFLRDARAHGATLNCSVSLLCLELAGQRWEAEASDGHRWSAPVLVNAAGAWVDEVAALAGVAPIGIEPRRRSAFTFAPPPGTDVRAWPLVVGIDEDFYFKPDAGLLLGSPANADPVPPHDVVAEELDVATGIARIEEATTMTIRRPIRTWAGLRSFVPSGDLVGGFDDAAAGFFWCCGQGGYGIQTSPAMGEACAARLLGRPLPAHIADQGLTFDALGVRR
jgi:D-arginine dehydrogenase